MMQTRTRTRATLLVTGLFATGLLAGAWTGAAAAARAQDPYEGLELFARVLTTIETDYVEEVDVDLLVDAAIRGMVEELDDHSRWLSAEEYVALQDDTHGHYEGIGVEVRLVSSGVAVVRLIPGGPALRDGLAVGDVILAVEGVDLAGLSLGEVSLALKGPRGSPVLLTVQREGWDTPREISTVRDRVDPPSVTSERLADGTAYVRLHQFQEDSGADLERELRSLQADEPLRALVLDLRDNPGGLLDEAVAVVDLFVDDGIIVSTRGRVEGMVEHEASAGGLGGEVPIVVLVNGMSASASEIVAGALQDTGRAVLVGTHTYGKGSVQVVYENRDGSALKLTIGRYYTPSGEPVAPEQGRVPDHIVEMPVPTDPATALRERIAQLELGDAEREELVRLVDALPMSEALEPAVPSTGRVAERVPTDPQLAFALELLQTSL